MNLEKDGQRNTKSRTELALLSLSGNLVGTFSIGLKIFKEKESAMSKSELLWHCHKLHSACIFTTSGPVFTT